MSREGKTAEMIINLTLFTICAHKPSSTFASVRVDTVNAYPTVKTWFREALVDV